MAGMTFDHQPSFDPFAMAATDKQYSFSDLSPTLGFFNPLEDFSAADVTSNSTPSLGSPVSPTLGNSYALPTEEEDWMTWDKIEHSPEPDFLNLKSEPFEQTILPSVPIHHVSLSPAINPMDLSNPVSEDVTLGREGINDNQPLFQSPTQPVPVSLPALQQQQPLKVDTSTITAASYSPAASSTSSTAPASQRKAAAQNNKRYPSRNLKRKSSSDEDDEDGSPRSSASPPPAPALRRSSSAKDKSAGETSTGPKKTAHNMIEKRYRTNLNDRIAALRDSVPALRVVVHKLEHQGSDDEGEDEDNNMMGGYGGDSTGATAEDLGGLEPAHKLNKATILSKATEYILHLERRNKNLARENASLKGKVESFEMLMMRTGQPTGTIWA